MIGPVLRRAVYAAARRATSHASTSRENVRAAASWLWLTRTESPGESGRGHQIRQWLSEQALDGVLQAPCAILRIGSFRQKILLSGIGDVHQERFGHGSSLYTPLHHLELNIDDSAQFLAAQRFEDYDLVQTVASVAQRQSCFIEDT